MTASTLTEMHPRETHEEFQKRMDRARDRETGMQNKEAIWSIVVMVAVWIAYHYLKSDDAHPVYLLYAGGMLLLLATAVSLLFGIHKSRQP